MGHSMSYSPWSSGETEAVLGFFTESSTFEDLAFEMRFDGLEQIRSFNDLTYAGVPDFRIVPERVVADESGAAAAWVMSGTLAGNMPGLPATGKAFEVRAVSMVTFEGDRILHICDYWNPLAFRRCVGLD